MTSSALSCGFFGCGRTRVVLAPYHSEHHCPGLPHRPALLARLSLRGCFSWGFTQTLTGFTFLVFLHNLQGSLSKFCIDARARESCPRRSWLWVCFASWSATALVCPRAVCGPRRVYPTPTRLSWCWCESDYVKFFLRLSWGRGVERQSWKKEKILESGACKCGTSPWAAGNDGLLALLSAGG